MMVARACVASIELKQKRLKPPSKRVKVDAHWHPKLRKQSCSRDERPKSKAASSGPVNRRPAIARSARGRTGVGGRPCRNHSSIPGLFAPCRVGRRGPDFSKTHTYSGSSPVFIGTGPAWLVHHRLRPIPLSSIPVMMTAVDLWDDFVQSEPRTAQGLAFPRPCAAQGQDGDE